LRVQWRHARAQDRAAALRRAQNPGQLLRRVSGPLSQKFPFNVRTAHTLKICEPHVITVTGKAFYDIGLAPANHSNRRGTPKGYAIWEIHPVMKMEALQWSIGKSSPTISRDAAGARGWSRPLILRSERSELLTRIATAESVSLLARTKS